MRDYEFTDHLEEIKISLAQLAAHHEKSKSDFIWEASLMFADRLYADSPGAKLTAEQWKPIVASATALYETVYGAAAAPTLEPDGITVDRAARPHYDQRFIFILVPTGERRRPNALEFYATPLNMGTGSARGPFFQHHNETAPSDDCIILQQIGLPALTDATAAEIVSWSRSGQEG